MTMPDEHLGGLIEDAIGAAIDSVMAARVAELNAAIRASERERIAAWLERDAARLDEIDFDVSAAVSASAYREAAEAIRCNMLEAP